MQIECWEFYGCRHQLNRHCDTRDAVCQNWDPNIKTWSVFPEFCLIDVFLRKQSTVTVSYNAQIKDYNVVYLSLIIRLDCCSFFFLFNYHLILQVEMEPQKRFCKSIPLSSIFCCWIFKLNWSAKWVDQ